MKTRVFGGKNDVRFWNDKPIQKGHPDFNLIFRLKRFFKRFWEQLQECGNSAARARNNIY